MTVLGGRAVSHERGTPVHVLVSRFGRASACEAQRVHVKGYLAHETTPTPLGPPQDPRHRPTVGSSGGASSYVRYPLGGAVSYVPLNLGGGVFLCDP